MNNIFAKLAGFIFPRKRVASNSRVEDAEILRSLRERRVIELGPTMGSIHSYAIPTWVRLSDGTELPFQGFVGADFALESIPVGSVVIAPGLLYGEPEDDSANSRI